MKTKQTMKTVACPRRVKRRKKDLPHLPREIIFNILIRLPAEFLHRKGKYVCKTWENIIRDPVFVKTHFYHSNAYAGLLIQGTDRPPFITRYLESKEGKIKVSSKKIHFSTEYIIASCEGILLSCLNDVLYAANCVTMQRLKLPDIPSTTCKNCLFMGCSLACIPHTGEFKVILPYVGSDGFCHWHVLTVGTDMSWRKIDSELIEDDFKRFMIRPISIKGVIYWASYNKTYFNNRFFAVDLHDESIHRIQVPEEFLIIDRGLPRARGLVKINDQLACIVRGANRMEVHVWVLNDLYSEWAKIFKFDIKLGLPVTVWDRNHIPIVWLDNGPVLVFSNYKVHKGYLSTNLVAYNLTTGVMRIFKKASLKNNYFVLHHTNSLVSL